MKNIIIIFNYYKKKFYINIIYIKMYSDKYLKYKNKYLELKNIDNDYIFNQIGGDKILEKKFKIIEFINKKTYSLNNMDDEKLDKFSEFPIASITKIFTIISLLLLHQNKKINIYDSICKYIDDKKIRNIKIIDIMNHMSGLKLSNNNYEQKTQTIKYDNATEIFEKWKDFILVDKKLSGIYAYSNVGYIILGVLIEKITNIKYSDFVKDNILIPLKMDNTGIEDCNITLYNSRLKKLNKYEKWKRSFASSAGELKSCINDLIKLSNFVNLFTKNTLLLLKNIYIFKENEKEFEILHNGNIVGGKSKLCINYNKKWINNKIHIELQTVMF